MRWIRWIRYLEQESIHMEIICVCVLLVHGLGLFVKHRFELWKPVGTKKMFTTAFLSQTATWLQRIGLVQTPGNSIWGECLVVAPRNRWLGGPSAGGQRSLVWTLHLSLPVLGNAEAVQRVNLHLKHLSCSKVTFLALFPEKVLLPWKSHLAGSDNQKLLLQDTVWVVSYSFFQC